MVSLIRALFRRSGSYRDNGSRAYVVSFEDRGRVECEVYDGASIFGVRLW
jgi:hypothetical protein